MNKENVEIMPQATESKADIPNSTSNPKNKKFIGKANFRQKLSKIVAKDQDWSTATEGVHEPRLDMSPKKKESANPYFLSLVTMDPIERMIVRYLASDGKEGVRAILKFILIKYR